MELTPCLISALFITLLSNNILGCSIFKRGILFDKIRSSLKRKTKVLKPIRQYSLIISSNEVYASLLILC